MIPLLDNFIKSYAELKNTFLENSEISFKSFVEPHLTKTFLLSCASFYESQIQDIIKNFMKNNTSDKRLISFATNKGIKRQYHTYFVWEDSNGNPPNNINNFLGLFGEEFKDKLSKEIKDDEDLRKGMRAFLIIGNMRNKMVHDNFLGYSLPNTFEEILDYSNNANSFLSFLKKSFN